MVTVTHNYVVADFLQPASGIVHVTDPLYRIRQYARSGGYESIIVVDANRPVGLIRWSDISNASTIPETSLARDIMLADSPALTRRTSVHMARMNLEITRMDRLPVIDSRGEIIGVFACNTPEEPAMMENGNTDGHDRLRQGQTVQAFTVHPGMGIYASDGALVGHVDRLFLEAGIVSSFLVLHGEEDACHKLLGLDVVEELFNDTVILSIPAAAFHRLPDIDPNALHD